MLLSTPMEKVTSNPKVIIYLIYICISILFIHPVTLTIVINSNDISVNVARNHKTIERRILIHACAMLVIYIYIYTHIFFVCLFLAWFAAVNSS